MIATPIIVPITHAHFFCGLGGGARGFNRGQARVGRYEARFRCLGGIDNDPAAIRDFSRAAGVPGTVLDLFSREQYRDFHGKEPGPNWREATIDDVRSAFQHERPNIVFLSAPCKGFSGLLPEASSKTAKYQALNGLTLRGVFLMLEAWKDDPPDLIVFENVPRIAIRGRHLLDQIIALLRSYGYEVAETTHDCGELGGLGQSRKRFLLVGRHRVKIPPFLYQPPKKRLRGVGEVLDRLPLPGDPSAGPMHRMPALQWKTWVRLAFVEAGADWRSLNKLSVVDGQLRDFGIVPDTQWQSGVLGVRKWDEPSGVVPGRSSPTNGTFAVADPRIDGHERSVQHGVRRWDAPSGVVTGKMLVGGGPHSVADPRPGYGDKTQSNIFRVVAWDRPIGTVTGAQHVTGAAPSVADPRLTGWSENAHASKLAVQSWEQPGRTIGGARFGSGGGAVADPRPAQRDDYQQTKYRVTAMDEPAGTVIAASTTGNGAFAVADPRPVGLNAKRDAYVTGGHLGVVPWNEKSRAVPGFAKYDRGPFSVADPRDTSTCADEQTELNACQLPAPEDRLVCVIRALDGTWHRPFTTLELAALQSLFDPDETFQLDGASDSAWRERIGNAVPSDAAQAVASVMGTTILLARAGETFTLSSDPIWVSPLQVALSVDHSPNRDLLD